MESGLTGKLLTKKDLKPRGVHPLKEMYGDTLWYHLFISGAALVIGGMITMVWVAIILSIARYIRAYLKINWTRSDEMQMHDFYQTRIVVSIIVFTGLWTALTILMTRFEFGRDCLYYSLITSGIYTAYQTLKFAKNKISKVKPKVGKTKTE